MDDLAVWLLEQIAEDDRIARAVDRPRVLDLTAWPRRWRRFGSTWSPLRLRDECASKRRIVEGLRGDLQAASGVVGADEFGSRLTTELKAVAVLRWLTLPYSDRPGYRAEWKP